ncbi:hypothetical protein DFH07DRAFT_831894 [Mycena maculata]|uniref:Alpha/beta hydrolase fold-3 domain-containing protein n=1 Tax=Mycena maculata TaxID=230809 RepID=A0AAD7INQ0_9AGAR|nr:hypothetical protein DFH07DRAFT_831894 [Mycena maculata]
MMTDPVVGIGFILHEIHGVAVLHYCELCLRWSCTGLLVVTALTPPAKFPTPLNQTCLALEFLLAAGVQPLYLQIAGDSAGENLILHLISQTLHPRAAVQEIRLSAPLEAFASSRLESR